MTGYVLHWGTSSRTYVATTNVGNLTNVSLSGLAAGRTYYFSAVGSTSDGLDTDFSTEVSHLISPRILGLTSLSLVAGTPNQRVDFTLEGGDLATGWTLGAASGNTGLIPNSGLSFGGTSTQRYLLVSPSSGGGGSLTLSVFTTDGTRTNRLSIPVTVQGIPTNVRPTLSAISDQTVDEDSVLRTVQLTGISSGSIDENQTLSISAVSSDPSIVPNPSVVYTSPDTTAQLRFAPVANANGSAQITVTVNDQQITNNLLSRSFTISVNPVNDSPTLAAIADVSMMENSGPQVVNLTGITSGAANENQTLTVRAVSSDPAIVPNPTVQYVSPASTGSLVLAPVTDMSGTVTISVTVEDGQVANSSVTRTFALNVMPVNRAPVVNVGTNTSTQPNVTFMVRARVTDDGLPANPGRTTARWTKVSGPGSVTIGNSNSALTTLKFSAQGMYRLRLTAFDGELTSSNDFIVFVRANTDVTPATFRDLAVTDLTDSTITLSWTNDELTTEQVEVTPQGGTAVNTLLNQALSLSHSVLVTNLEPDSKYTLRARTRDASGNLSYSDPVVVTTLRSSTVYVPVPATQAQVQGSVVTAADEDNRPYHAFSAAGAGSVRFAFFVPVGGVYHLWGRLRLPSADADAFAISVDTNSSATFDLGANVGNSWSDRWQWVLVRSIRLVAGAHQLTLDGVEPDVAIGQFLLTNARDFSPRDEISLDGIDSIADQSLATYVLSLRSGWSILSLPLGLADSSLSSVFAGAGIGSRFLKYDANSGSYTTNVLEAGGWRISSMTVEPGEGGLFFNPAEALNWTLTGTVPTYSAPSVLPGLNLIAPTPSKAGALPSVLADLSFQNGDLIHRLSSGGDGYMTYSYDGQKWDSLPLVNIGEGFLLDRLQ
mgnify:CR=1 FL=1